MLAHPLTPGRRLDPHPLPPSKVQIQNRKETPCLPAEPSSTRTSLARDRSRICSDCPSAFRSLLAMPRPSYEMEEAQSVRTEICPLLPPLPAYTGMPGAAI